jgi:hypothetical protein
MYLVTQIQNKLPDRKVDKSENIHTKERNKKKIDLICFVCNFVFRFSRQCVEFSLFHRNIFLRQIVDNSKIRNSRIPASTSFNKNSIFT